MGYWAAMGPSPPRPRNLLVVGDPGAGRTTVLQKLVATLPRVSFGGFVTREVGPRGHQQRLLILEGRQQRLVERPLRRSPEGSGVSIFDPTCLVQHGLPALEHASRTCHVVLVDELGPDEAAVPLVGPRLQGLFDAATPVVATGQPGVELVQRLGRREDTRVLECDPGRRAVLAAEVADLLVEMLESARPTPRGTGPHPAGSGPPSPR